MHLVRPLCGIEDGADIKNASLLSQEYAPLTVSFVAESSADPGLIDAQRLCLADPLGSCIVAKDASAVSGKARNMIAGWRSRPAKLVAFCDSDIELAPDDLGRCVDSMLESGASAGFAPCLFDAAGCWGRLAMQVATVDKFALAEAGAVLGIVPCLEGGLMVVSRSALEASGGIEVVASVIADDLCIARVLRAHGFRLSVSAAPVLHRTGPESAKVWAQRYLRWSICRRAETPGFQLFALAFHPILVPLAVACSGLTDAWTFLVAGVLGRIAYAHAVDRFLLKPHGVVLAGWCWARPIAEVLDAVFVATAFLTRSLTWRGSAYRVDARGRISRPEGEVDATAMVLRGTP